MPRYNFTTEQGRYEAELFISWDDGPNTGFEEFLKYEDIERVPYEHPLHLHKVDRFVKIANPDAPHYSEEELKAMDLYKLSLLAECFYPILDFYPGEHGFGSGYSYRSPLAEEIEEWIKDGTLSRELFEKDILKNVTNIEYWDKVDGEEDDRIFRFEISGYSQNDYAELYIVGEKDYEVCKKIAKEFQLYAFTAPYFASIEVYDTMDGIYVVSEDVTEIYDDTSNLDYLKEVILDLCPEEVKEGIAEYMKDIRAIHVNE